MASRANPVLMPSQVSSRVGFFDRFAGAAALIASRATFFAFCVLLVVVWLPSYFLIQDLDTWQLIINTMTTIVTFLMVALLQNTQTRSDQAVQHKLNAIAHGLADLMDHLANGGVARHGRRGFRPPHRHPARHRPRPGRVEHLASNLGVTADPATPGLPLAITVVVALAVANATAAAPAVLAARLRPAAALRAD